MQPFDSPVRVRFDHYRVGLIDIDNYSIKGCLDGIVAANVLVDDSPAYVREVIHRQHKIGRAETERTVVTIEEIG